MSIGYPPRREARLVARVLHGIVTMAICAAVVLGLVRPRAARAFSPGSECASIGDGQTIDQTLLHEHWSERPYLYEFIEYADGSTQLDHLRELVLEQPQEPWASWFSTIRAEVDRYVDNGDEVELLTTIDLARVAKRAGFLYRFFDLAGDPQAAGEYAGVVDLCFDASGFRCDTQSWTGDDHYLVRSRALLNFALAYDFTRAHWYGPGGDLDFADRVVGHLFTQAQDFYIEGLCNGVCCGFDCQDCTFIDIEDNNWTLIPFSAIGTTMLAIAGADCSDCDNGPWTCLHGDAINYEKMVERSRNEIREALEFQITRNEWESGSIGLLGWAEGSNYYSYSCSAFLPYQVAFKTAAKTINGFLPQELPESSLIFDDPVLANDFYYTVLFSVLSQSAGGERPNVDDSHHHGFASGYLSGIYREIHEGAIAARLGARDYQGVPSYLLLDWDARKQDELGFSGAAVDLLMLFRDNRADYERETGLSAEEFSPPAQRAVFAGHAGAGIMRSGWGDDDLSMYVVTERGMDFDWKPFTGFRDRHEQDDDLGLVARAYGEPMLIDGGYGSFSCRDQVSGRDHHSVTMLELERGYYMGEAITSADLLCVLGSGHFDGERSGSSLAWARVWVGDHGAPNWRQEERCVWMIDDRFWVIADRIFPKGGSVLQPVYANILHGPTLEHEPQDSLFNRGVWQSGAASVGMYSCIGLNAHALETTRDLYKHEEVEGCSFAEHYASVLRFRLEQLDRSAVLWSLVYPMAAGQPAPRAIDSYESANLLGMHISDAQEEQAVEYLIEYRTEAEETPAGEGGIVGGDSQYAVSKLGPDGSLRYFLAGNATFYTFNGETLFDAGENQRVGFYLDQSQSDVWYAGLQGLQAGAIYKVAAPGRPLEVTALEVSVEETRDISDELQWSWPQPGELELSLPRELPEGSYLALKIVGTTVLRVPADYPTIQAALDAAHPGMCVEVAPGTYREHDLDFGGKAITLRSQDPEDPDVVAATRLSAEGAGTVILFDDAERREALVDGLTIRGGKGEGWPVQMGGGITLRADASPTIRRCVIENNGAVCDRPECVDFIEEPDYRGLGGGIRGDYASPLFDSCIIRNNLANRGGGAYFLGGSPLFVNCLIVDNDLAVDTIYDGQGGAVFASESQLVFRSCTVANNNPGDENAGLYLRGGQCDLLNSVVWANGADDLFVEYGDIFIDHCDIGGPWEGAGVIHAAPLFAAPEVGDYHLRACSPCIDTAASEPIEAYDFEGDSRPWGAGPDIGADEARSRCIHVDKTRAQATR